MKHTIHHCLSYDNKTTPPTRKLTYEADTEQEAIRYLEKNGGGLYRNILHNLEYKVRANA